VGCLNCRIGDTERMIVVFHSTTFLADLKFDEWILMGIVL